MWMTIATLIINHTRSSSPKITQDLSAVYVCVFVCGVDGYVIAMILKNICIFHV